MFLVSLIAVVFIIILCMGFSSMRLLYLIDIPTMLILVITLVTALLQTGLWKDFNNSFRLTIGKKAKASFKEIKRAIAALQLARKTVTNASLFTLGISIITIMTQLSEPETLGPNLAVAVLSVVYAAFFNIIFLPMEKQLEVQLIEFDGEEQ